MPSLFARDHRAIGRVGPVHVDPGREQTVVLVRRLGQRVAALDEHRLELRDRRLILERHRPRGLVDHGVGDVGLHRQRDRIPDRLLEPGQQPRVEVSRLRESHHVRRVAERDQARLPIAASLRRRPS